MISNSFRSTGRLLALATLALMPIISQAASDRVAPGKLTYGTAATFMPFEFVKDGKLTGFDIELIPR